MAYVNNFFAFLSKKEAEISSTTFLHTFLFFWCLIMFAIIRKSIYKGIISNSIAYKSRFAEYDELVNPLIIK